MTNTIPLPKEKQIIEKDERIPAIISEELWDKANDLYKPADDFVKKLK